MFGGRAEAFTVHRSPFTVRRKKRAQSEQRKESSFPLFEIRQNETIYLPPNACATPNAKR
jgi:hypothetical protein